MSTSLKEVTGWEAALGHESFRTTAESYAQRDAVASAQQKKVLGVLAGGKLAS